MIVGSHFGGSDYSTRVGLPSPAGGVTLAGWFRLESATSCFGLGASGDSYCTVFAFLDGTTLYLYDTRSGYVGSAYPTVALNTWIYVVLKWTSATTVSYGYITTPGGAVTWSQTDTTVSSLTFGGCTIGYNPYSANLVGTAEYFTVFDSALSDAAISANSNSASPIGAWANIKCESGDAATDSSGNARNFTVTGTPTASTYGVDVAPSDPTGVSSGTSTVDAVGTASYDYAVWSGVGTLAYSATNGTSVTPAFPSGISADDLLLLFVHQKPSTNNRGTVTAPSGWTQVTDGYIWSAGGYGTALAVDTGNTNLVVFSKDSVTGSETGTQSVTVATNSVCAAQIHLIKKDPSKGWSVAATTGSKDAAGATVSISFASNIGIEAHDVCIAYFGIATDVTTPNQFTSESITAAGVTFGTTVEVNEPDSSNGNDIGGVVCRVIADSGTSSAAPAFAATASGTTTNVRGPAVLVRVRSVSLGSVGASSGSSTAEAVAANLGSIGAASGTSTTGAVGSSLVAGVGAAAGTSTSGAVPLGAPQAKIQVGLLRPGIPGTNLAYAEYHQQHFRDSVTGDLVWLTCNTALDTIYIWTKQGDQAPSQIASSSAFDSIISAAQDGYGDVHILGTRYSASAYIKATLTRSGGHITGWSLGTAINLPSMTSPLGGDIWGGTLVVEPNGNGVERVIIGKLDGNNGAQYCAAVCHSSLTPTQTTDFVSLSGAAGWTKFPTQTSSNASVSAPYCFNVAIETYGTAGNLFVTAGASSRGDVNDYGCSLVGHRCLASSTTWTVDTANPCTLAAEFYETLLGASCYDSSGNAYISWTTRADLGTATVGLSRILADGTFTANWVSTTFTHGGEVRPFPAVCDDGTVILICDPGINSGAIQEIKVYSGETWYSYWASSNRLTEFSYTTRGGRGWTNGIVWSAGDAYNPSPMSLGSVQLRDGTEVGVLGDNYSLPVTSATATISPTYADAIPHPTRDMHLAIVGQKSTSTSGGTISFPSGWTEIGSIVGAGGYASQAADAGNVDCAIASKDSVSGDETGSIGITLGSYNAAWALMFRVTKTDDSPWLYDSVTGSDETGGTALSITYSSAIDLAPGDMCVVALSIPTDVTTPRQFTGPALSATGITFGECSIVAEPYSADGNDVGGLVCYARVLSGSGLVSVTFTATAGGTTTNVRGGSVLTRVRAGSISYVGLSEGTSTTSGIGSAIRSGVGAVAGTSTTAGVGSSIVSGIGVASGTSPTSGIGASIASVVGSSVGISTSSGVGSAIANGVGAVAGTSPTAGVGASIASVVGSSVGISTSSGAGASIASGIGAIASTSPTTGVGASIASGVGASAGTSTTTSVGESLKSAVGTCTGVGIVLATGASISQAIGAAPGIGVASATGIQAIQSVASAIGLGVAAGVGLGASAEGGAGSSVGTSTTSGVGTSISSSVGVVTGTSTTSGVGTSIASGVGAASGTATALGKQGIASLSDLGPPSLWLKAGVGVTLSGSDVTQWQDQSPAQLELNASNTGITVGTLANGKAAVVSGYAGSASTLSTTTAVVAPGSARTVVVFGEFETTDGATICQFSLDSAHRVACVRLQTGHYEFCGGGTTPVSSISGYDYTINTHRMMVWSISATRELSAQQDSTVLGLGSSTLASDDTDTTAPGFSLFGSVNGVFASRQSAVAEVLVYPRVLTADELDFLLEYGLAADGSSVGTSTTSATGSSVASGTGVSSCVSGANGVSNSIFNSVAISSGISTASFVGAALSNSIATSDGTSSTSGFYAQSGSGAGSSSGIGTVSGVGKSIVDSLGTSTGVGAATAVGNGIISASGNISGTSTSNFIGSSLANSIGSCDGITTSSFIGAYTFDASGNSAGSSTVLGIGLSAFAVGISSGISIVTANGSAITDAQASSVNISSVSGIGTASKYTTASSDGIGQLYGVGSYIQSSVGSSVGHADVYGYVGNVGVASGASLVSGAGSAIINRIVESNGFAETVGISESLYLSVGISDGYAIALGSGVSSKNSIAESTGSSNILGYSESIFESIGNSLGQSIVSGIGVTVVESVATANGNSISLGSGSVLSDGVGTSFANSNSNATGVSAIIATGIADGSGDASAIGISSVLITAVSSGLSFVSGISSAIKSSIGTSAGSSSSNVISDVVFTEYVRCKPPVFFRTFDLSLHGLRTVVCGGDGSIALEWHKQYITPNNWDLFYNLYWSTKLETVYSEGVKFVIKPNTQSSYLSITISGSEFIPGKTYHFAVKGSGHETNTLLFDQLASSSINTDLKIYPEDFLVRNMSAVDMMIAVNDVSVFPQTGIVLIGAELISYSNIDLVTNSLIVSERGSYGYQPRMHTTDGYDGVRVYNDSLVRLWKGWEDDNTAIGMTTIRFDEQYARVAQDGYGFRERTDILSGTSNLGVVDSANNGFPAYDQTGWDRTYIPDYLSGKCIGTYFGGEYGCADGSECDGSVRGLSVQDHINMREEYLLEITGEPVMLFRRQWSGKQSQHMSATRENTTYRGIDTYGTSLVTGYEQYFSPRRSDGKILVRFGPTKEDLKREESGIENSFIPNCWTVVTPTVKDGDFIIRFNQDGTEEWRYEIIDVDRNRTLLQESGAQKFTAIRVRKTDPICQVRAIRDTSTLPSEILTSIGMVPGPGGILAHMHRIVLVNGVCVSQLTSVDQGHNHQVDSNNIVGNVLGHSHNIIIP